MNSPLLNHIKEITEESQQHSINSRWPNFKPNPLTWRKLIHNSKPRKAQTLSDLIGSDFFPNSRKTKKDSLTVKSTGTVWVLDRKWKGNEIKVEGRRLAAPHQAIYSVETSRLKRRWNKMLLLSTQLASQSKCTKPRNFRRLKKKNPKYPRFQIPNSKRGFAVLCY